VPKTALFETKFGFGESIMNSVEPNPNSAGSVATKAILPFSGQGVIFAKSVSPALKRAKPELSNLRLPRLRTPAKFSPIAAISING
jgi:hypothetical protein